MSERFIKLNDTVYYESTLRLMNDEQLNELVSRCQNGIIEIKRKLDSYKNENYDENNIEHYEGVIRKFNSAIIYLEADIVLLENIRKDKKFFEVSDKEDEWYRNFFSIASAGLFKPTILKLVKKTNEVTKYEMQVDL